MKLTNILEKENNALIFEQHMNNSRTILSESVEGMNAVQRAIVEGIYNDLKPLIEASLTADQVQQLFKGVEQNVSATGNNRTLIGAGKDAVGKANDTINKVGRWLQDTTPVKMADQKFEQLKAKVSAKFPELDKQLTGFGSWMKENPGKSAAIIGVLTVLASLAGGPVGGAIAGQILRGSAELIKGEKLSTAVGKGIKTAALGYLSGKAFDMLGKFVGVMRAEALPIPGAEESGLSQVTYGATKTLTAPGFSSKDMVQGFNVAVFPQEQEGINAAMEMIKNGQPGGFDTLQTIAREIRSADYKAAIKDVMAAARSDQLANDSLMNWINGIAKAGQALSQGAVAAAGDAKNIGKDKKESYYVQACLLSEGQVYLLFDRVCSTNNKMLSEGVIWEADDPAAPKMSTWDKIKTKASEFGKNLTTKVTASKLNSAWKAVKQPTDSEELAAFLVKQGVNAEVVGKTYADMKLSKPKAAQAAEKPAVEKPAAAAGQDSAAGAPAASAPSTAPAATTPTVEKPAVSTSATGSGTDSDATPQPNAAGSGSAKNTNTLYSQVRADIKRLDKRSKQQLMTYLEKGLGA